MEHVKLVGGRNMAVQRYGIELSQNGNALKSRIDAVADGTSISRYFPAIGTAGLERIWVKGYRRLPCPPPKITASTFFRYGILKPSYGNNRQLFV
jgi:hypothetical protein